MKDRIQLTADRIRWSIKNAEKVADTTKRYEARIRATERARVLRNVQQWLAVK